MNQMIDVTRAMQAKSDQLNAEDLIAGPRTIRIRDAVERDGKIRLSFDGDDGRPWVLSKTAVRVLAACWGQNAAKWIGLSCTVYNDESVVYGGKEVGGIRVSHVEGISSPRSLNLTVIRGRKKEHVIEPLVLEKATKADAFRQRLFAVASDPTKSVAEAWALVKEPMRKELGAGLYEQLLEVEKAAQAHANSDDAVLDSLNNQIAGE